MRAFSTFECGLTKALTIACSAIVLLVALNGAANAQDDMETARTYPPSLITAETNQQHLQVIDWRRKQVGSLIDIYRESRDRIQAEMSAIGNRIEKLNQSLPDEVRFLNESGRSELASSLTQQMLEIRLDLATREKMLQMETEREPSEMQKLELRAKQEAAEAEVLQAELRLRAAREKMDRTSKLIEKGLVSSFQLNEDKLEVQSAELSMSQAQAKLTIVNREQEASRAEALASQRTEMEPLRTRLKVVNELIATLATSSEAISKIEAMKRSRELLMRDLEMVAEVFSDLSREQTELDALKGLIEDALKQNKPEAADK